MKVTLLPIFFSLRHSRFGGCYVIQGLKAIGDRDVVMHKGLHNVSHFKLLCASLERVEFFQDAASAHLCNVVGVSSKYDTTFCTYRKWRKESMGCYGHVDHVVL